MVSFVDNLKKSSKNEDIFVEEISRAVFIHSFDMETSSDPVLFLNHSNKGIFVYRQEDNFIVVGSVINDKKRKLMQLLVLTLDKEENCLLDNTGNKISEENVIQTLISWLK